MVGNLQWERRKKKQDVEGEIFKTNIKKTMETKMKNLNEILEWKLFEQVFESSSSPLEVQQKENIHQMERTSMM